MRGRTSCEVQCSPGATSAAIAGRLSESEATLSGSLTFLAVLATAAQLSTRRAEMAAGPSRAAAPNLGLPLDDHVSLDSMDCRQFILHPLAQYLICEMQASLLEKPYNSFGKTVGSEDLFNLVLPSTFGSDRRKPVTSDFQAFTEAVYWPLFNALLFGSSAWSDLAPFLTCFKVNTLRISEDEFYYNQPIYHFHLDHRIGALAPKDHSQKRTSRMIFSAVPAAMRHLPLWHKHFPGGVTAVADPAFDSTVYLKMQPPHGFHSNATFTNTSLHAIRSAASPTIASGRCMR